MALVHLRHLNTKLYEFGIVVEIKDVGRFAISYEQHFPSTSVKARSFQVSQDKYC